jgi:hypothetical protein
VPSSISSSEPAPISRVVPAGDWGRAVTLALLLLVAFVGVMEARLAWRGFVPTLEDSSVLWATQRGRASSLGTKALILIGGSRIHLAADLDVLRQETGLEPVQLAIDGSNFLPVLTDLASDPSVRGTVLVDFGDHLLLGVRPDDTAHKYVREYQNRRAALVFHLGTFARTEPWLENQLHARLRSYADGARPLTALWSRLVRNNPVPQYLVMRQDRSRLADYSRVQMPEFYYARVMRNLSAQIPVTTRMTHEEMERELRQRIEAVSPMEGSLEKYLAGTRHLAGLAARIREHGGSVRFLLLPSSKLVRLLEERRFPRALFWDRFAETVAAPTLHFEDVPALREFTCPDGSHLDFRDRARFSAALVEAIGIGRRL